MSVPARVSNATGARSAARLHRVQELWSGWGEIARYQLRGGPVATVIVKQVQPPAEGAHPRGWDSDRSDRRKRHSYLVERAFYQFYAPDLPAGARVARTWALDEGFFVLEDLDAAGFPGRARGALPLDQ
ncbi:MAG: choline kinase, partial [Myxococcota bacterium]